jgi:hypothetical protein
MSDNQINLEVEDNPLSLGSQEYIAPELSNSLTEISKDEEQKLEDTANEQDIIEDEPHLELEAEFPDSQETELESSAIIETMPPSESKPVSKSCSIISVQADESVVLEQQAISEAITISPDIPVNDDEPMKRLEEELKPSDSLELPPSHSSMDDISRQELVNSIKLLLEKIDKNSSINSNLQNKLAEYFKRKRVN